MHEMTLPDHLLEDPFGGGNSRSFTIRIPDTLYNALVKTAAKEDVSLPSLVRHAIYFQFFPSILQHNLELLQSKYPGEMTPKEMVGQQFVLSSIRSDLTKLLEALEAVKKSEAIALDLKNKLVCLEREYQKLWGNSLGSVVQTIIGAVDEEGTKSK